MKKLGIILLIGILACTVLCAPGGAVDTGLIIDQHTIDITVASQGLRMEENMNMMNSGSTNVTSVHLWLPQDARDIQILAKKTGTELSFLVNGFVRECNLTDENITILPDGTFELRVIYSIPTTMEYFEKTLVYTTNLMTITYNERQLFEGKHLVYDSDSTNSLKVRLYQPTEAPLSTMSLIIIFALVVLLFAVLFLSLRSSRAKTKRGAQVESEETLTTKKALLLELLKELEKQYRAKSVSDETYNNIKEEYKQQAVDVMKKLDDLKK